MSHIGTQPKRPRRNGVYWGDTVSTAARVAGLRKHHVRLRALMPDGKQVSSGTIDKLWIGYNGGGPVEAFTATPVIELFKHPEIANRLIANDLDPERVILPQEFRFKADVRPVLLGRVEQLALAVKSLNRPDCSYISSQILYRALLHGGCFTRRHIVPLAQLAYEELRRAGFHGLDLFTQPEHVYETVALDDAYPSAYREASA